jgi:hypothetical protein
MVDETLVLRWRHGRDVTVDLQVAPGGCQIRGSFGEPPITVVRQGDRYWAEARFLEIFVCSDEYEHLVCGEWKGSAQEALDALERRLFEIEEWVTSIRRAAG